MYAYLSAWFAPLQPKRALLLPGQRKVEAWPDQGAAQAPERRHRRAAALPIGMAASLLVLGSGCAAPQGRSATGAAPGRSAPPHVLEAHYFIGYGEEDSYDPKASTADAITDGTRYRILVTGNGPEYADMRELLVFDGHRLFVDESDSAPRYVLYDSPHQHPRAQFIGSALVYDPGMAPWGNACGHTAPVPMSTGTILGRSAQSYRCTGRSRIPTLWVDKATHLVLQAGPIKAQNLSVNPPITSATFSTQPPKGVHVRVVRAR